MGYLLLQSQIVVRMMPGNMDAIGQHTMFQGIYGILLPQHLRNTFPGMGFP